MTRSSRPPNPAILGPAVPLLDAISLRRGQRIGLVDPEDVRFMPADSREGNERFFPPESVSRVLAEFIVRFNNDEESGFMDRRELMTRAAPVVGTGATAGMRREDGWRSIGWCGYTRRCGSSGPR